MDQQRIDFSSEFAAVFRDLWQRRRLAGLRWRLLGVLPAVPLSLGAYWLGARFVPPQGSVAGVAAALLVVLVGLLAGHLYASVMERGLPATAPQLWLRLLPYLINETFEKTLWLELLKPRHADRTKKPWNYSERTRASALAAWRGLHECDYPGAEFWPRAPAAGTMLLAWGVSAATSLLALVFVQAAPRVADPDGPTLPLLGLAALGLVMGVLFLSILTAATSIRSRPGTAAPAGTPPDDRTPVQRRKCDISVNGHADPPSQPLAGTAGR